LTELEDKTRWIEKRQFKRAVFREAVQYQAREASDYGGCLAHDVSEGGIRINSNDFIPLDTEVSLSIRLHSDHVAELAARVVWIQKLPYAERYQVGLEFVHGSSNMESKEDIRNYIQSQQE